MGVVAKPQARPRPRPACGAVTVGHVSRRFAQFLYYDGARAAPKSRMRWRSTARWAAMDAERSLSVKKLRRGPGQTHVLAVRWRPSQRGTARDRNAFSD